MMTVFEIIDTLRCNGLNYRQTAEWLIKKGYAENAAEVEVLMSELEHQRSNYLPNLLHKGFNKCP